MELNPIEKHILKEIADIEKVPIGSYNIRKNGHGIARNSTSNIEIISKKNKPGIDIIIKENTKNESVHILNPQTIIHQKKGSSFEMETVQIKGVDSTIRNTIANLEDDTNLVITERLMTHGTQTAKTSFEVNLNGENSSTHVTSRSVAKDNSSQEFISKVIGNTKCFGHVECDAILMNQAKVTSTPEIVANNLDANLIHEAAIGKIAGDQLIKLMTLGLTEQESEEQIINGFLK